MSSASPLVVTLQLERLDDLFDVPSTSPLSPEYQPHSCMSGVEFAAAVVAAHHHRGDLLLDIWLSGETVDGDVDLAERARAGVQRWAGAQHERQQLSVASRRRFGYSTLVVGLILLFLLITAAGYIGVGSRFSWRYILAQGLEISAWVALWTPIEHFIFGLWGQRDVAKDFATLAGASVEISRHNPSGVTEPGDGLTRGGGPP